MKYLTPKKCKTTKKGIQTFNEFSGFFPVKSEESNCYEIHFAEIINCLELSVHLLYWYDDFCNVLFYNFVYFYEEVIFFLLINKTAATEIIISNTFL